MYCRNCGHQLPEDAAFCTKCGYKIHRANHSQNSASGQNQQGQNLQYQNRGTSPVQGYRMPQQPYQQPPKKKKSNVLPIVIGVIAALLIILVAVILLVNVFAAKGEKEASDRQEANIAKDEGQAEKGDSGEQKSVVEADSETESVAPAMPAAQLTLGVQQVDVTNFPEVRIYMNVNDAGTQEVVKNLDAGLFYINKKDANGNYVKQKVSEVTQLNEAEALNIDMVADLSGSMSGAPIEDAKNIMTQFVNTVQFEAGDQVELTTFATGVQIAQEFCADRNLLISDIQSMYTEDMTSLYDALYTAVNRVASQSGAKCVIAFTDGEDNYSHCSMQDVVDLANRYHVPVFIIGIGEVDYSPCEYIAGSTGGRYYNVYNVSDILNIYNDIYRLEKEMYMIVYEDTTDAEISDEADLQIGYASDAYEGTCEYAYTPNVLLNVKGQMVYTSGPEAVVEKYIKNFDSAVTLSDFSYISDCLLPGSDIYREQEDYVKWDVMLQFDSFELVDTTYSDSNNCVITTRETYYCQVKGKKLNLMTQECKYALVCQNGRWYMTNFVGNVNVLYRINQ